MPNVIDHLNEEGTRELIQWVHDLSESLKIPFNDLTVADVERAFEDLPSSDPLVTEIEQLIADLREAADAVDEKLESINDYTTGINLVRGSRDFTVGTVPYGTTDALKLNGVSSPPSGNFELYKDELGYSVYRYLGNASTATYKFLNVLLPSQINGHSITISFEYMVESETATNGMLFQLLKMNLNEPGQTVKVFYYSDTDLERPFVTGKWYKIVLHYDEPFNLTEDEYLRLGLTCGPNADLTRIVNYRKVKVEIGHVNNPIYSVSPLDMALEPFNDITNGINLLRGTRDFTQGTKPWATSSYWKLDGFGGTDIANYYTKSIDSDGFTVIHTENPADSTTIRAAYSNMVTGFNLGDVVTYSFDFKIDDIDLYDTSQTITRYDVFPAGSTTMTYGANFYLAQGCDEEIKSGVWYRWSLPITLNEISSNLDGVMFSSRTTRQAGISFRKIKLERGRVKHTEWSASPFDVNNGCIIVNNSTTTQADYGVFIGSSVLTITTTDSTTTKYEIFDTAASEEMFGKILNVDTDIFQVMNSDVSTSNAILCSGYISHEGGCGVAISTKQAVSNAKYRFNWIAYVKRRSNRASTLELPGGEVPVPLPPPSLESFDSDVSTLPLPDGMKIEFEQSDTE